MRFILALFALVSLTAVANAKCPCNGGTCMEPRFAGHTLTVQVSADVAAPTEPTKIEKQRRVAKFISKVRRR